MGPPVSPVGEASTPVLVLRPTNLVSLSARRSHSAHRPLPTQQEILHWRHRPNNNHYPRVFRPPTHRLRPRCRSHRLRILLHKSHPQSPRLKARLHNRKWQHLHSDLLRQRLADYHPMHHKPVPQTSHAARYPRLVWRT